VNTTVVKEYIGKIYYRCGMCHEIEYSDKYLWIGTISKTELKICSQCTKREGGKKWQEENQRLKNLKQKLKI
jgi:protein-arginine kinase activator protein McsA